MSWIRRILLIISITSFFSFGGFANEIKTDDDVQYVDTSVGSFGPASLQNRDCIESIDPSSEVISRNMFRKINEKRVMLGLKELMMPNEMQCRAQKSVNHVVDAIRDNTKANLVKVLSIRPGEDFTAEYGDALEQKSDDILNNALNDPKKRKKFLPFFKQYTQIGVGYAFDRRVPGYNAFAAWVFIVN